MAGIGCDGALSALFEPPLGVGTGLEDGMGR